MSDDEVCAKAAEERDPYAGYDPYATWVGGKFPELPCPHCAAVVCLVGSRVRAKVESYNTDAGVTPAHHTQHGLAITCPGCGVLVAVKAVDLVDKASVVGEIRKAKDDNVKLRKRIAELTEQQDALAQWQARLEKLESALDPVRDLKAENRRLQQELVVARNEAVKLRTLAERRYAELSELRGATT